MCLFRTAAVDRSIINSFLQPSNRPISVSADRFRRDSAKENTYNHVTSTPSSSRYEQVNDITLDVPNGSFSIDSIPPETRNILTRFPEFRRLVREYKHERQKCNTWINDYARLKKNYEGLKEKSFLKLFVFF